jgi:uncharacterized membrane protein
VTEQSKSQGGGTSRSSGSAEEPAIGLVTDGAYALIVARFRTMEDAEEAYEELKTIEHNSSYRIDGVVIASKDAKGDIHLGRVTDHSTRTGLRWGLIGGIALGIVFPPSIIAGAAGLGTIGAAAGKVRNVSHRSGLATELDKVMTPNSAGLVALVEDTAVVEIERALAKADQIVSEAVDEQVAKEIDREAARAKEAVGV